jgi:hypothetical protein
MEAINSSETSVHFTGSKRRHIQEDGILYRIIVGCVVSYAVRISPKKSRPLSLQELLVFTKENVIELTLTRNPAGRNKINNISGVVFPEEPFLFTISSTTCCVGETG